MQLRDWECRHVNGMINWNNLREIAVENVDFDSVTLMHDMSDIASGMKMPELREVFFSGMSFRHHFFGISQSWHLLV